MVSCRRLLSDSRRLKLTDHGGIEPDPAPERSVPPDCPTHITASVYINDDERGLLQDYEDWLEELAPHAPTSHYRHNRTGEDACPSRTGSVTRTSSVRSWDARSWSP